MLMPASPMRLIKKSIEYQPVEERSKIPESIRGVYVLYNEEGEHWYNVVYVGMSTTGTGVKSRINAHARSKRKSSLWTHFSIYEVWDNIRDDEIKELEGLLRQIYRYDQQANSLNKQKSYTELQSLTVNSFDDWFNK